MSDIESLQAYGGQLAEAAESATASAKKQHEYVNGDASTDVHTESGSVPSLAKQAVLGQEKVTSALKEVASQMAGAMTYDSTEDGIKSTVDGGYFSTPSSESKKSLVFWRNTHGVAVYQDDYPNSEAVKDLQYVIDTETELADVSDYEFVIGDDDNGKVAIGITKEGKTDIGAVKDVGSKVAQIPGLSVDVKGIKEKLYESEEFEQSGYSLVFMDSENSRVAAGFDLGGDLIVRGRSVHKRLLALEQSLGAYDKFNKWINGSATVIAGGDSLTQGAGASSNPYPKQLSALLGVPVINVGVGGQNAQQIATRQGGYINLLTVANNTIPASGPVAVTAFTQTPITNQGGNNMAGALFGIPGKLSATFDSSGNRTSLTFTRAVAGSTTIIDPATPFIPDTGDNELGINVLWYGRNNFWTGRTDFDNAKAEVKSALAATIGNLKAVNKKFIVMGVLTDNKEAEWAGTEKYKAITSLNEELKALYPRNFIDIRRHLVRSYNPARPQDVIDFGHDVTPTSLLSDTLHLNEAGYAVVARVVYNFIIQNGWVLR